MRAAALRQITPAMQARVVLEIEIDVAVGVIADLARVSPRTRT